MAANTKIEWAHHTWSPWLGCSKISAGCSNCYAENMMDIRYGRVKWGPGGKRVRTSAAYWKKPLQWNREAEKAGTRYRIFPSLCDPFEDRPELEPWRLDLFRTIMDTPHLDWLLLTKRPENIRPMIKLAANSVASSAKDKFMWLCDWIFDGKAPHNVWLGTSVEDQDAADIRIPYLVNVPAKVRFLSCEPLLGPVDLTRSGTPFYVRELDAIVNRNPLLTHQSPLTKVITQPRIDWVIVGGESGSNARPMEPAWVLDIRDQCQAAGVPFFFKQGSKANWGKFKDFDSVPLGLRIREVPEVHHAYS